MGNKKSKQSNRQRSKNSGDREQIVNDGYGFLNNKFICFQHEGYKKIKVLNKMNEIDYQNEFFKCENVKNVNKKSEKKIREILRIKKNIDLKILELEHYNRELNKELDRIDNPIEIEL